MSDYRRLYRLAMSRELFNFQIRNSKIFMNRRGFDRRTPREIEFVVQQKIFKWLFYFYNG